MTVQNAERPPRVQVALDDAGAGATVLELSTALAAALACELDVVYVESAASVSAAALAVTRVLPHAGSAWLPLRRDDVEQGFRSHAERLRLLTERIAGRRALRWSLRVVRGNLSEAPALLSGESTLLFLATAPPPGPPRAGTAARRRRPLVALAGDDGPAAAQALSAATRLASALDGLLQAWPQPASAATLSPPATVPRPDVLVMTRRLLTPATLALPRCPLLLVG